MHPAVKECNIPMKILYNEKIERIRFAEYDCELPPNAIHFVIADALNGNESEKQVQIKAESTNKVYKLMVDLDSDQKIYETQLEKLTRDIKFKKKKPLSLTDYTKSATGNSGVSQFIKDLKK